MKIGSNLSGFGSRYQSLRYQEKSSLVDELVEISGYHRKTSVRLSRQRWNAMGTWRLNQFSGRSCCKSAQPGPIDWWIWHEKQVVSSVAAAARAMSRAVVDAQQCARSMAGRILSGAGLKWMWWPTAPAEWRALSYNSWCLQIWPVAGANTYRCILLTTEALRINIYYTGVDPLELRHLTESYWFPIYLKRGETIEQQRAD